MEKSLRELLLKDLCGRLPCGLMVQPISSVAPHRLIGYDKGLVRIDTDQQYSLENIKPYLRPMSSMTKAERAQLEFAQELDTRDAAEISISHVLEFFPRAPS